MKIKTILIMILMSLSVSGCSANSKSISGTVIDAETGKPIEGAVVFVEWSKSKAKWTGLGYTETYKTVEKVTDKTGKFKVFGVISPFVNPPTIVVYKKGYVAWRNDYIFPLNEKRQDFRLENGYVIRLEYFKNNYSHSKHIFFFQSDLSLNSSAKLYQAYEWENPLASREEELLREKRKIKKYSTYTEQQIWEEIIKELYLQKKGIANE